MSRDLGTAISKVVDALLRGSRIVGAMPGMAETSGLEVCTQDLPLSQSEDGTKS